MPSRTAFLKAMLWSLGFAAAGGILAALLPTLDVAWRIVGSAGAAAAACGLMIPASMLLDRQGLQGAGMVAMTAVLLEFLMALTVIWELPRNLLGQWWEVKIILTMLLLAGCGLGAILSFTLGRLEHGSFAGRVGLTGCALVFMSFILEIWEVRSPAADWRRWNTGWAPIGLAFLSCGVLATLGLIRVGDPQTRKPWREMGFVASVVACLMWLWDILIGSGSDLGFAIFCTLICGAAAAAHANVCGLFKTDLDQSWVKTGTVALGIVTAIVVDLYVINDEVFHGRYIENRWLERLLAACAIAAGCGTLALVVLHQLHRRVARLTTPSEWNVITLTCPHCGRKQSLPVGEAACAGCGLKIAVRLTAPHCPRCDYPLLGLTSTRCPECGVDAPVPPALATS